MDDNKLAYVGKSLVKAFLAGMAISCGCLVYMGMSDFRWVGAFIFAVGLTAVVTYGLNLYTGKVCYVFENSKWYTVELPLIICGNLLGCLFMAFLFPHDLVAGNAFDLNVVMAAEAKVELSYRAMFAKGFGCGIMMFLAVDIYRRKSSYLGIFTCVPLFILAGFEHSVADMFYFFSAGMFTVEVATFLVIVILGNAVGGFIIPLCRKFTNPDEGRKTAA